MKQLLKFSTFAFIVLFLVNAQAVQAQKMSKQDKKQLKMLMAKDWETKNIEQDGKPIDLNSISGKVYMYFFKKKVKNKKTKKTTKSYRLKINMGGNDRIFNFNIKNDSIQLVKVKGWNDFKIISIESDRLVIENVISGSLMRWNMIPKKEEDF